jgi:hypothetical protein
VLDEENPESVTYVIPRSEDVVLGGTSEHGEWRSSTGYVPLRC